MPIEHQEAIFQSDQGCMVRGDFAPRQRLIESDLYERIDARRSGGRTALQSVEDALPGLGESGSTMNIHRGTPVVLRAVDGARQGGASGLFVRHPGFKSLAAAGRKGRGCVRPHTSAAGGPSAASWLLVAGDGFRSAASGGGC